MEAFDEKIETLRDESHQRSFAMDLTGEHSTNGVTGSPSLVNQVGRLIFAPNMVDVIVSVLAFMLLCLVITIFSCFRLSTSRFNPLGLHLHWCFLSVRFKRFPFWPDHLLCWEKANKVKKFITPVS